MDATASPPAVAGPRGPVLGRRRALGLLAAAGLPLLAGLAADRPMAALRHEWRGVVLGGDASILLYHPDADAARRIIAASVAEVRRLERIFSLHSADSEIAILNRTGRLAAPSHDMVRLLAESLRIGELTDGAFDITVQPLWRLYADHFARRPDDPVGPERRALAAACAHVDYRAVDLGPALVTLPPGTSITLNGIAQGYITDRVADLLRDQGMTQVLLALGETRALGTADGGRPWRVGLRDPLAPASVGPVIDLVDQAVACSGGYGTRFDRAGRHHHLFDPATGCSAQHYAGVSVVAPRATLADALSTALYVMPPERLATVVEASRPLTVMVTLPNGTLRTLAA